MRPYLVVGTPRTRTAWIASFLSTEERPCQHEPSLHFDEPTDLNRFLEDDAAAASDSMMTFLAADAKKIRPDCIIVVVRRPIEDVRGSFASFGITFPQEFLDMLARRADTVASTIADLSVSFDELGREDTCRKLYETCTERPFDRERWLTLRARNIQRDIPAGLRLIQDKFDAHLRVFGPHYEN